MTSPSLRATPGVRFPWLLAGGGLLLVAIALSLFVGARTISPLVTFDALLGGGGERDHIIVREIRLPRTLLAIAVGAALAVAGCLMQGLTRNPLASPELLGIGHGASFAIVLAIYFAGVESPQGYVWFALLGAAVSAVVVYVLAGAGSRSATPIRLAISGTVLATAALSWTQTVMALDRRTLDEARFWIAGSIAGRPIGVLTAVLPFLVVGAVLAIVLVRALDALALGDDAAVALGFDPLRHRLLGAVAVTLLAGGAVAAAGPLAFIGLAAPHLARQLCGPEHRVLLPACAILGPALLLLADVIGRIVLFPLELEAGIVTALLGAPVLIILVRRVRLVSG
ncbi:iron ABC transporter permease [Micromonospora sp. ATCC 39149]|uniref:Iron chelate uptake ABC transporter family permease subunit n=1 Tax=Micromonospora carbonacea TaxID=47853 RepID=A0A7D6C3T6_9ACTN|nr:iron chelate uptake ABC transporter family permease subunit [Micromonospora sp. ATCC 39149]QLJ96544.1 iron chelate uptake ABC transporter family permease subunit [Micromonospora carbonacea]